MSEHFTSNAEWPEGTVSFGNTTSDNHGSREAAAAVCRRLERMGLGGDGKVFPLRTWVGKPQPAPAPVAETPRTDNLLESLDQSQLRGNDAFNVLEQFARTLETELARLRPLEGEVERLRALLKPIADWQSYMDEKVHYAPDSSRASYPATAGDFRKIIEALSAPCSGGWRPTQALIEAGKRLLAFSRHGLSPVEKEAAEKQMEQALTEAEKTP